MPIYMHLMNAEILQTVHQPEVYSCYNQNKNLRGSAVAETARVTQITDGSRSSNA